MMDELPPGWALARLESLVGPGGVMTDGDWVESKDQDPDGEVRLIQLADVGDGSFLDKSNRFMTQAKAEDLDCTFLQPRDVLISRLGDPLGKTCLFPGLELPCVTVVDVHVVRPTSSEISREWLVHLLNSAPVRRVIEAQSSGTTRKRITGQKLKDLKVRVAPAPEQRRIASKIDELFSRIDEGERALERVQKLVERYRQSVLKAAVTGELTRDWREKNKYQLESGEALLARILKARREAWEKAELDKMKAKGITPANDKWKQKYEEPVAPDTSELPDLPTGWVWSSGAQLFDWASGDFLPAKAMQLGDVPVYGGNGVNGQHSQANVDFATIVVGRVGVHCGNVHLSEPKCWVTDNAIYATRLPIPASLEFLLICLRSAKLGKTSQGGAQPFVNQKALNDVAIPIPPLAEQITIVDVLAMDSSRLDGALAAVWAESRRTAALRRAVLKSAFSGLLVSQQPDDTPAAELLDRIAADRSHASAKSRRGITRESGKA